MQHHKRPLPGIAGTADRSSESDAVRKLGIHKPEPRNKRRIPRVTEREGFSHLINLSY